MNYTVGRAVWMGGLAIGKALAVQGDHLLLDSLKRDS